MKGCPAEGGETVVYQIGFSVTAHFLLFFFIKIFLQNVIMERETKKLNIVEIIGTPNAILAYFGNQVYEKSKEILHAGYNVEIDFENVNCASSSFFRRLFGQLYDDYQTRYKELVSVANMDRNDNWTIKYDDAILWIDKPEIAKANYDAVMDIIYAHN